MCRDCVCGCSGSGQHTMPHLPISDDALDALHSAATTSPTAASATAHCSVEDTAIVDEVGIDDSTKHNVDDDDDDEIIGAVALARVPNESPPCLDHAALLHRAASPATFHRHTMCSPLPGTPPPTFKHSTSAAATPTLDGGETVGVGAKRKIRPVGGVVRPECVSRDYYAIWTAHRPGPQSLNTSTAGSTAKHRPLERSWPPRRASGQANCSPLRTPSPHRCSAAAPFCGDVFHFDIVDTDDPPGTDQTDGADPRIATAACIDFEPGEFFADNARHAGDGQPQAMMMTHMSDGRPGFAVVSNAPARDNAPLATPETDGSMVSDRVRQTPKLKPLLKKRIGPDHYISTILTAPTASYAPLLSGSSVYDFPFAGEETNSSTTAAAAIAAAAVLSPPPSPEPPPPVVPCTLQGIFIPLKPHKPLSRQLSGGAEYTNGRQESRAYATARSPPSGSSTRSASPLDQQSSVLVLPMMGGEYGGMRAVLRPQPRLLTRVGGAMQQR